MTKRSIRLEPFNSPMNLLCFSMGNLVYRNFMGLKIQVYDWLEGFIVRRWATKHYSGNESIVCCPFFHPAKQIICTADFDIIWLSWSVAVYFLIVESIYNLTLFLFVCHILLCFSMIRVIWLIICYPYFQWLFVCLFFFLIFNFTFLIIYPLLNKLKSPFIDYICLWGLWF